MSTCIAGRLTFNPDTITVRISKLSQLAPAVRPYMGLLWVCAMYIMRYVWGSLTLGVYTSLLREEVREGGREGGGNGVRKAGVRKARGIRCGW